jgi:hypothetical protein
VGREKEKEPMWRSVDEDEMIIDSSAKKRKRFVRGEIKTKEKRKKRTREEEDEEEEDDPRSEASGAAEESGDDGRGRDNEGEEDEDVEDEGNKGAEEGGDNEPLSTLDDVGLGGVGGIAMNEAMKGNLRVSAAVQAEGESTKLGVTHSLSSVSYFPKPSEFRVASTGKFLRKSIPKAKKFDPFAFRMTRQARQGEATREQTLEVDFVIANTPPAQPDEDPVLVHVSEMLSKAYNKFLFLARCLEQRDELGAWVTLRDAIFSTAHNLTIVHDARVKRYTGKTSYTSRAVLDSGFIRESVREVMKKSSSRKDTFFQSGGGPSVPPDSVGQTMYQDPLDNSLFASSSGDEDLLFGSLLDNPPVRGVVPSNSSSISSPSPQSSQDGNRAWTTPRSVYRPPSGNAQYSTRRSSRSNQRRNNNYSSYNSSYKSQPPRGRGTGHTTGAVGSGSSNTVEGQQRLV